MSVASESKGFKVAVKICNPKPYT